MSTISIETIGPDQARKYLDEVRDPDGKFRNRSIRELRVSIYARAMTTPGEYDPNLPLIAFDGEDRLVGGFHTLLAVERSETTWDFRVAREVAENLIPALNDSRSGSAADDLRRLGYGSQSLRAAVARMLLDFDKGRYFFSTTKLYSVYEISARAVAETRMDEAIDAASALSRALGVNKTISATAFIALCDHLGETETREMFGKLVDGTGLDPADPVKALRTFLERSLVSRTEGRRSSGGNRVWCAFLEASRLVHEGSTARSLRIPLDVKHRDVTGFVWWLDEPVAV